MSLPARLEARGSRLYWEDERGLHYADFGTHIGLPLRASAYDLPELLAELYNSYRANLERAKAEMSAPAKEGP